MADIEFRSVTAAIHGRQREYKVVNHPGGAGVLAIRDGKAVLVEQYRPAVGRNVLEVPAGMLEGKEDPLICAQRELQEETGLTARIWYSMGSMLVSPGYTTEELFLFVAEDVADGEQNLDEGEDIAVHWMDLSEARRKVESGELNDSKTAMLLQRYWLGMARRL